MITLISIILISGFILESVLSYLNINNWSPHVPPEMKDVYQDEKYLKARNYAQVNYRFGTWTSLFSLAITLIALWFGLFGKLDEWVRGITESPTWIALLFFTILGMISDLISLPFTIYRTFVIEEKFGFNKTTVKTFITDKLKGYLLALIIGGIVIGILVRVFEITGKDFWWLAWIFMTVLMLLITLFYTSWILPLFNKLTPLPEGELRNAIDEYSQRNNFPLKNIFVIDGSKRSSKANAFFSGLGKKKKIVLYDTLIKEHSKEELIAVLAHETGHYKLKHTRTGMLLGLLQTGLMLYIYSLIQGNPLLMEALQANQTGLHLELLAFGFLYIPVSSISGIFMHIVSRKHEFQADEFARKTYDGQYLIKALKKLSADNLSNLTPHPAYVFVHYSHPPLLQRIKRLRE